MPAIASASCVSWPQTLSLSFLGRVCSLLPSGSPPFKVSRRLRQSLVAMLLVSLSPVSSQVSAILMVLETWSQGHKNSPSRRGVQGGRKPPSRGGPGGPPRGGPGGPPRPRAAPARGGAPGAREPILAILGGFRDLGGFWRFWGFLALSLTPFTMDLGGSPPILFPPLYTPYTPQNWKNPEKTEISFCPDWESY